MPSEQRRAAPLPRDARCCRRRWSCSAIAMLARDARSRAAGRCARVRCSACCSSPPAPGAPTSPGGASDGGRRTLGSPALFVIVWTSLASAIYFSLGVVAENALGLTPVVFLGAGIFFVADRDDLRRGRVAAPGARGLDGLRALRLQRAVELHRRLGGAAGLPHPDRGHGVRRDELPGRVLGRRWAAALPELAIAIGDHRLRRGAQHPRPRQPRRSSACPRSRSPTSRCRA